MNHKLRDDFKLQINELDSPSISPMSKKIDSIISGNKTNNNGFIQQLLSRINARSYESKLSLPSHVSLNNNFIGNISYISNNNRASPSKNPHYHEKLIQTYNVDDMQSKKRRIRREEEAGGNNGKSELSNMDIEDSLNTQTLLSTNSQSKIITKQYGNRNINASMSLPTPIMPIKELSILNTTICNNKSSESIKELELVTEENQRLSSELQEYKIKLENSEIMANKFEMKFREAQFNYNITRQSLDIHTAQINNYILKIDLQQNHIKYLINMLNLKDQELDSLNRELQTSRESLTKDHRRSPKKHNKDDNEESNSLKRQISDLIEEKEKLMKSEETNRQLLDNVKFLSSQIKKLDTQMIEKNRDIEILRQEIQKGSNLRSDNNDLSNRTEILKLLVNSDSNKQSVQQELYQENNQLKENIEHATQENKKLMEELNKLKESINQNKIKYDVGRLEPINFKTENETESLFSRASSIEFENLRIAANRDHLQENQKPGIQNKGIETKTEEIEQIKTNNKILVSSLETLNNEKVKLTEEVKDLHITKSNLINELNMLRQTTANLQVLTKIVEADKELILGEKNLLEDEVKELRNKNNQLKKEIETLLGTIYFTENKVKNLELELRRLAKKKEKIEELDENLIRPSLNNIDKDDEEIRQLMSQIQKIENEHNNLKIEYQKLQNLKERADVELEKLNKENIEFIAVIQLLKRNEEILKQQFESLNQEKTILIEENNRVNNLLKNTIKANFQDQSHINQILEIQEMTIQLEKSELERKLLIEELEKSKAIDDSLQQEKNELFKSLESLKTENQNLRMSSIQASNDYQPGNTKMEVESKTEKRVDDIQILEKSNCEDALVKTLDEKINMKKRRISKPANNNKKQITLQEAEQKNYGLTKEKETIILQISHKKHEIEESNEKLIRDTVHLKKKLKDCNQHILELEASTNKYKESQAEIGGLRNVILAKNNEIENLKSRINENEKKIGCMNEEIQHLQRINKDQLLRLQKNSSKLKTLDHFQKEAIENGNKLKIALADINHLKASLELMNTKVNQVSVTESIDPCDNHRTYMTLMASAIIVLFILWVIAKLF